MHVISPLIATGILKVQHHLGYLDASNFQQASSGESLSYPSSTTASASSRSSFNSSGLLLGLHSSKQSALSYEFQLSSREDSVIQNVVKFLYCYFFAPTEENWVETPMNKDTLLPHVISAVMKSSTDFLISYELCSAAYSYAYQRGLYSSAYLLGRRALELSLTLLMSPVQVSEWRYNIASCCFQAENFLEAEELYREALEAYRLLSDDVTEDVMIAKIYSEMSDLQLSLNNYEKASLHLVSMSEIWFTLTSQVLLLSPLSDPSHCNPHCHRHPR
jgi:tetratricopeptide (TPR) repeat protein